MRNSFFEFNVAVSGLMSAKAGLAVTSHNTANAATTGYSRQYIETKANVPLTFFDGRGMVGTGSDVTSVKQIRSFYLDTKYWRQKGTLGEYTTKYSELSLVEVTMNELSGTGISGALDDFFNTLSDLHTTSADATYRTNVLTSSSSLATFIQNTAQTLQDQQRDINDSIASLVKQINSLGAQITSLNKEIFQYEMDGSHANDLRDQRALLVDELSSYVNVTVEESAEGHYSVLLNGYDFVNHYSFKAMRVEARDSDSKANSMDAGGLYDIYIGSGNTKFNLYSSSLSGELKGLIDVRDGNNNSHDAKYSTSSFKGIPYYMEKLNQLVRTLAKAFNEGLDKDGKQIPGAPGHVYGYDDNNQNNGLFFFTFSGSATTQIANAAITGSTIDGSGDATSLVVKNPYNSPDFDPNGVPKTGNLVLKDANGNILRDNDGNIKTVAYTDWTYTNGQFEFTLDSPSDIDSTTLATYNTIAYLDIYDQMTALNFQVNSALISDPLKMACRSQETRGESANDVIEGFMKIKEYGSLFKEGKLADYVIGMSGQLGIDVEHSLLFTESYTDLTTNIQNQRLQVSGVSLNEEMINLVKYQQLYQACSKLINVIDSIYDTTVNRLGNF